MIHQAAEQGCGQEPGWAWKPGPLLEPRAGGLRPLQLRLSVHCLLRAKPPASQARLPILASQACSFHIFVSHRAAPILPTAQTLAAGVSRRLAFSHTPTWSVRQMPVRP